MDRMFGVYICIPGWLYLLLTAPNELTLHAAAPLSLAWIAASAENLRGHALNRYSSVAEHTVRVSVPPPHGRHRGCESQNFWWILFALFRINTVSVLKDRGRVMFQPYVGKCGCDYAAEDWGSYYHPSLTPKPASYCWTGFARKQRAVSGLGNDQLSA